MVLLGVCGHQVSVDIPDDRLVMDAARSELAEAGRRQAEIDSLVSEGNKKLARQFLINVGDTSFERRHGEVRTAPKVPRGLHSPSVHCLAYHALDCQCRGAQRRRRSPP